MAVAYPFGIVTFGDAAMVFLAVVAMRPVRKADRFGLWCVLGGLVAMALADSAYAYLAEKGSYATGDLVGAGWAGTWARLAVFGRAAAKASYFESHKELLGPGAERPEGERTGGLRPADPALSGS